MKNLILITALMVTTVFLASANIVPTHFTLNVLTHQKAIILNLSDIEASSIVITDKYGDNVFTQEIKQYDNGVKYMMSSFPSGKYTIRIQGKDFVEMYEAIITSESLSINNFETYSRPSIVEANNTIIVDTELQNDEKIQFSVYNQDGFLVYTFNDTKEGRYNRAFNLNQLEKGQYNVVVSTKYFTETKRVSL